MISPLQGSPVNTWLRLYCCWRIRTSVPLSSLLNMRTFWESGRKAKSKHLPAKREREAPESRAEAAPITTEISSPKPQAAEAGMPELQAATAGKTELRPPAAGMPHPPAAPARKPELQPPAAGMPELQAVTAEKRAVRAKTQKRTGTVCPLLPAAGKLSPG